MLTQYCIDSVLAKKKLIKMDIFIFLYVSMATILMDLLPHAGTLDIQSEMTAIETPLNQSPLFPLLLESLATQKHTPDSCEMTEDEYDYIIVGGGAAGSVVASRLSDIPCVKVLLLEAGPKPPLITEVPGIRDFLDGTYIDWKFETVPQKNLDTGLKNKQMRWSSGKVLGGSGTLQHGVYVRGNRKDYDDWAAQGAKGWSYADVFPYFLKLEDNRNIRLLANGYHAFGGPITVEEPRFNSSVKSALYDSVRELGYQFVDPNAATQLGYCDYQLNIRNDQRCSSVKGYLVPVEYRANLDILLEATATKVIMEAGEAKGVQFYHNGELRIIKARQEVIVSCGAVNTPQLLMLSGIGPREELEKWKIPVIADLPVGKNLHDHEGSGYFFTVDPQHRVKDKLADYSTISEYINYRSGLLSYPDLVLMAFIDGLGTTTTMNVPNNQFYILEITKDFGRGLEPEVFNRYFGPIDDQRAILICWSTSLQRKSRGAITLRSLNPFDPPFIDPNYLADPKSLNDIVDGLKVCKNIVNTAATQRLGAKPFHTVMPGCEKYVDSDDDYFKCFARHYLIPVHHAVGTSKMGDARDPSTVVDPELRVKNVRGLRVVDASVMPIAPSGNTNIPTIMIAEKASDMIKETMRCF